MVASHWSVDGTALNDGWLHLRLERVAREVEHDRGHPLTPGRHDRAIAKALRARGRPEVAEALEAVSGVLPRSATTPEARQRLRRAGVSDVAARSAVKAAWASTAGPGAFQTALIESGFSTTQGKLPGVWVVTTTDGTVIGALDRILRQKRAAVAARMESSDEHPSPFLGPNAGDQTSPAPGQEILIRTRIIDRRTTELLRLLDLLEEREGPSPLEALRETLVEILVAQRETRDRLTRIEGAMRLGPSRPPSPAGDGIVAGSGRPPPRGSSVSA